MTKTSATAKDNNIRERNTKIRAEIQLLIDSGLYMKQAIGIISQRFYISERTVRDVVYDKRRK